MFSKIFYNKKILITGHTGFKGSWMISWLKKLKPKKIIGIASNLPTRPSHYQSGLMSKLINNNKINLVEFKKMEKVFIKEQPDFVFHMAANALVRDSYTNPMKTWQSNLMGTVNILECLRKVKKKCVVVMVTSDKSYENKEWTKGYKETDRLGGNDPYSASKGASELIIKSYVKSFFSSKKNKIRLGVARAGNVIGGGDWAKDRIVPDCIKAWSKQKISKLRNPHSTRPWQHVIEPITGYLLLAKELSFNKKLHGEAFNFGPQNKDNRKVIDLVKGMSKEWKNSKWQDVSKKMRGPKEAKLLKLNCNKALKILKWKSILNFKQTMKLTIVWYKNFYEKKILISKITDDQINYYCNLAKKQKIKWAK